MKETEIRIIAYNSEYYSDSVSLRDRVLRKPLGLKFDEEFLAQDEHDIHIGAFLKDKLIGILILKELNRVEMKMRQVAVDPDYAGQGIGSKLVIFSEMYADEDGYKRIVLHARENAVPFYEKLSYKKVGDSFKEVGIKHYRMYKDLLAGYKNNTH